jgi:hypothetical protein
MGGQAHCVCQSDAVTDEAVAKLQALVRLPPVSDRDPTKVDTEVFDQFADHLEISDADVNWFEAAQLIVSALCNATKTVGGAIASSIFAIALATTGSLEDPTEGHAPLSGYLTVWSVCSVAALLAAVGLLLMPKVATTIELPQEGVAV